MTGFEASCTQQEGRRNDIQSLRAAAIALVVLAHADLSTFAGGFVGVDVFFVLSGFLISGLVLREIEVKRTFDAPMFYARRLKRLLPAMLFVFVIVALAAEVLTSPMQQIHDAAAAQAATLWLSNLYFASRSINYFSEAQNGNLFLHTWSLAVEEQFYVVWPWLLLFFYGTWRGQAAPHDPGRFNRGLLAALALSLALSVYLSRTDVEAGFYLMPSRIWEFSLGALCCNFRRELSQGRHPWLEKYRGRSRINTGGYALIVGAALAYDESMRYPGLWALLPCMGAAMVLVDAPEKRSSSLLSSLALRQPALQFLGNISYSLYLWHWPVLLIGAALLGGSLEVRLGLIVLAVGAASATYYLIEHPIHARQVRRPLVLLIASVLLMAAVLGIMQRWQGRSQATLQGPEQAKIQYARMDAPRIYANDCDTWYHSAEVRPCSFGPQDAAHTVVMFGDSVLAQWYPAVESIYLQRPDWRIVVFTKSSCPAAEVSFYYDRIKSTYSICEVWRGNALEQIARLAPDIVIMGSSTYGFTDDQWVEGTRKVLERLSPAAGKVAIMSPTPRLGFDGPNCLAARTRLSGWFPAVSDCTTPLDQASDRLPRRSLARAVEGYPNVRLIDLGGQVCPEGLCRARIGTSLVYRDSLHLTATFAQSLSPFLANALQQVMASTQTNPERTMQYSRKDQSGSLTSKVHK